MYKACITSTHITVNSNFSEVYCTSERFVARCSGSDVILMRSALYGRPRPSRCITSEYSHAMGCYSDVTSYMDDLCSGRQNCSMLVAVVDSIAQPCAKDFKSYLEVVYECIRGQFLTAIFSGVGGGKLNCC